MFTKFRFAPAGLGIILALGFPALIRAHGGEDHGAPKPAQAISPGLRVASASSDRYEVVIKYPAGPVGKAVNAQLFLSDLETNAPIAGAKVTLEIPDQEFKIIASPDKDAGIYAFEMIAKKAGEFDGLVTIEPGGDKEPDLLPVPALLLGPIPIPHTPSHWLWYVGGTILFLVAGMAVLTRMRRTRRPVPRDMAIFPESEKVAS